jgi:predicted glycosyltransferase
MARNPRATLVLLMRDITFGPEQTKSIWQGEQVYSYLEDAYDRILIYGDRRIFDPIAAYDLSDATARHVQFCGYLSPPMPQRNPAEFRAVASPDGLPLVVVSVGGGADGAAIIKAYLRGLTCPRTPAVASYVVVGPLLPEEDRIEIKDLASECPNLLLTEFDPDFPAAIAAADVVVGMGGYNSVTEAIYFRKRPVIVPRLPGPEEQVLRAEGFARLGLATVVDPTTLSPDTLWDAVRAELQAPSPPDGAISFTGLDEISTALADLRVG